MEKELSVFEHLNAINVNGHVEKLEKGRITLSYLSWAWAWGELMKLYPDATYEIEKFGEKQLPYTFDEETGYMVWTKMTINGVTREMWLPVMDGNNDAMKSRPYEYTKKNGQKVVVATATMFDINKAIMRCLVKNIALFGLGLYIYAGEDLPDDSDLQGTTQVETKPQPKREPVKVETPQVEKKVRVCTDGRYVGIQQNAGTITDMQTLRMRELGINLDVACEFLNVPSIDLMSVEQADYLIRSKENANKKEVK